MMGDKSQVTVEDVVHDMKSHIEKIVKDLFGAKTEMRWILFDGDVDAVWVNV